MKLLLSAAAVGVLACLASRWLLMPWHKRTPITLSEQKRAAWGSLTPRYRQTQRGLWRKLMLRRPKKERAA